MSNPLVSVCVITYNSSKYVLETLESIKAQTYQNIELIVSDDCSKDNTYEICKSWLEKNKARFIHTAINRHETNQGIVANVNDGVKLCHGEWIKPIGGDDIMCPKGIEYFMESATDEKNIIIGMMQCFIVNDKGVKEKTEIYPNTNRFPFFDDTPERQHYILQVNSFNMAPGAIVRRRVYESIGYYNPRYPMIEDLPFWLKATGNGFKMDLCKEIVVNYRTEHNSSVFQQTNILNKRFYQSLDLVHLDIAKELPLLHNFGFHYQLFISRFFNKVIVRLLGNKKNILTLFLQIISFKLQGFMKQPLY